ncbi:MAG: phage terminase large subunit, partial [Planctomycetota bacterium]
LEGVESEEQREKLWEWFMGTVLKAGQPNTNVVLIGTVLHHDSLLGRLTDERQATGGWRSKRYRAVQSEAAAAALWDEWRLIRSGESMFEGDSGDEAADAYFQAHQAEMLRGAEVLWPQRESYLDLMKMKQDEGEASFQAEKQNEPIDPATCLFANARFRYWDRPAASGDIGVYSDVDDLHRALGNRAHFVMACDPSLGTRRGEGDYGAVVVVIRDDRSDSGDEIYVVHAMIERRTPTEMIEHMVELGKVYPIDEVVIESNQFQAIMADELEQRLTSTGTYCQVNRVNNRSNKRTRILGLEPLVASGRLRFCSQHERLIQQLRDFPLARHDDGPDALEMAVNAANGPKHYSYSFQI